MLRKKNNLFITEKTWKPLIFGHPFDTIKVSINLMTLEPIYSQKQTVKNLLNKFIQRCHSFVYLIDLLRSKVI